MFNNWTENTATGKHFIATELCVFVCVWTQAPYWSFNCCVHGIRLIYCRRILLCQLNGEAHSEFCYFYAISSRPDSRFILLSAKYTFEYFLSQFFF